MSELETKSMTDLQLRNLRRQRTKRDASAAYRIFIYDFLNVYGIWYGRTGLQRDIHYGRCNALCIHSVIMQFYYFMHMKDKGHEFAKLFMLVGMFFQLHSVSHSFISYGSDSRFNEKMASGEVIFFGQ